MKDFIPVEGNTDLVRDPHSRALINTDIDAYNAAKKRRSMIIEKNQEIADLKNDVKELKDLVYKLVSKMEDRNE